MEVNETNRPLTETPMEQPIEAPVPTVEDTEKETSAPKQTLEEVVQRLKEINEKNDLTDKQEIDSLKQTFYKLQKAKSEAARKAFIDEGGKAEDFTPEKTGYPGKNEVPDRIAGRYQQDIRRI